MARETTNPPPRPPADSPRAAGQTGGRPGSLLWILISVLIVVASAGAGFVVSRLLGSPREAHAAPQEPEKEPPPPPPGENSPHCAYYDFEAITVNLNEARLARYLLAKMTLAIPRESFDAAKGVIENKKPELISWLNAYLSGCTMEEVRGTKNQNRLAREIRDAFNERLWPDRRPVIEQVLFTKFAIQ